MIDGFLQEFRGRVLNKYEQIQTSKPRAKKIDTYVSSGKQPPLL